MGHGVGTYFEAAVVIVALVFVGQVLELRARERTGDAIRALLDLAPKTARRILPTARNTTRRWRTSWRATGCACAPAMRSRWTGR
jgi:cation transport ATPase